MVKRAEAVTNTRQGPCASAYEGSVDDRGQASCSCSSSWRPGLSVNDSYYLNDARAFMGLEGSM